MKNNNLIWCMLTEKKLHIASHLGISTSEIEILLYWHPRQLEMSQLISVDHSKSVYAKFLTPRTAADLDLLASRSAAAAKQGQDVAEEEEEEGRQWVEHTLGETINHSIINY